MSQKTNFKPKDALTEYLLSGGEISLIEAQIIFGIQNLNAEITRLRNSGFFIKRKRVPMAKVIRRANETCTVKPPSQLPVREILVMEYWVENV